MWFRTVFCLVSWSWLYYLLLSVFFISDPKIKWFLSPALPELILWVLMSHPDDVLLQILFCLSEQKQSEITCRFPYHMKMELLSFRWWFSILMWTFVATCECHGEWNGTSRAVITAQTVQMFSWQSVYELLPYSTVTQQHTDGLLFPIPLFRLKLTATQLCTFIIFMLILLTWR